MEWRRVRSDLSIHFPSIKPLLSDLLLEGTCFDTVKMQMESQPVIEIILLNLYRVLAKIFFSQSVLFQWKRIKRAYLSISYVSMTEYLSR